MRYKELLLQIMQAGEIISPRGQEVRELVKTHLRIDPSCNLYSWPKARPLEKITGYLWEELAWYLSGDRRADGIA